MLFEPEITVSGSELHAYRHGILPFALQGPFSGATLSRNVMLDDRRREKEVFDTGSQQPFLDVSLVSIGVCTWVAIIIKIADRAKIGGKRCLVETESMWLGQLAHRVSQRPFPG